MKQIQHSESDSYIEFSPERGLENVKRIIFSDKFYGKEQYSLKVFSFQNGAEQKNFEEEEEPLDRLGSGDKEKSAQLQGMVE